MSRPKWRGNTLRCRGMKPIKIKQPSKPSVCACESSATRKCICGHAEECRRPKEDK